MVAGYYLAKSLYGRVAGVVSTLVIAVNPFQILYSKQAYIEATVITFILFALLLFREGVDQRTGTSRWRPSEEWCSASRWTPSTSHW